MKTSAGMIIQVCDELKEMLLTKNKAYGNSALDPLRIFSKASPEEQILVRLDDKLSRLARGEAAGEDVFQDFLGYLILLEVSKRLRTQDVREAALIKPQPTPLHGPYNYVTTIETHPACCECGGPREAHLSARNSIFAGGTFDMFTPSGKTVRVVQDHEGQLYCGRGAAHDLQKLATVNGLVEDCPICSIKEGVGHGG